MTLLDKDKRAILTGEVRLPYQKDGGSPDNEAVVQDARQKALRLGVAGWLYWREGKIGAREERSLTPVRSKL